MAQERLYQGHDLVCDSEGKVSEVIYFDKKEYFLRYMEDYNGIRRFTCWSEKIDIIDNNYEYVGYYGYDT